MYIFINNATSQFLFNSGEINNCINEIYSTTKPEPINKKEGVTTGGIQTTAVTQKKTTVEDWNRALCRKKKKKKGPNNLP